MLRLKILLLSAVVAAAGLAGLVVTHYLSVNSGLLLANLLRVLGVGLFGMTVAVGSLLGAALGKKGVRVLSFLAGLFCGVMTFFPFMLLFAGVFLVTSSLVYKAIDPKTSMRGWVIATGILAAIGMFGSPALTILFYPVALILGMKALNKAVYVKELRDFGAGVRYCFIGDGTGIAVATDRRVLKLKLGRVQQSFPFADVRSWECNHQSGGEVVGSRFHNPAAILGLNWRVEDANERATGLFVHLRSIDFPEWRIAIMNVAEQKRWMEILQQSINEPTGSASPNSESIVQSA